MNIALSRDTRVHISLGVLIAAGLGLAGNWINGLDERLEAIRETQARHTDMLEDMCLLVKVSVKETEANRELRRKVRCDLSRRGSKPPGDRVALHAEEVRNVE